MSNTQQMEDVAIGYGFNKLPRSSPNKSATIGKPLAINKLGDIVRKTEPHFHVVECFHQPTNRCPISPACGLASVLAEARDAFLAVLDRYTLADIVQERSALLRLLETR